MLKQTASVLALALAILASHPTASRAQVASDDCAPLTGDTLRAGVEDASIVVIAQAAAGPAPDRAVVVPEAYLKGAADGRPFTLQRDPQDACQDAELAPGARVLLVLESEDNRLRWPDVSRAFVLENGTAANGADPPWTLSEGDLVGRITDLTGQAAIPVAGDEPSARIDWVGTVLPVGAALLVVFGIGLVMMRVWHRIDPS